MNKYIIISPVRNESNYIRKTIESVICQTIKPVEWIIVNDGSTDNTEKIAQEYTKYYQWIKLINKSDRGFTLVGRGVIEAFNAGFKVAANQDWDFIVKLDCDITIDKDFFKDITTVFEKYPNIGILGGSSFVPENNHYCEEKMPEFHPWAGARCYRNKCFKDIGGLKETMGWDTLDLLKAQMRGWETKRLPDLKIIHHRRMSSRKGLWEGKIRGGKICYITGYHPLFLILRCLYRLFRKPFLVESFGVLFGYTYARLTRMPLIVSPEEKAFHRKQQLRRIIKLPFAK